jgi:putative sterol carrier protein
VAVPLHGIPHRTADATVRCTAEVWAAVLGGRQTLSGALAAGALHIDGDTGAAATALACFDVRGLQS